MPTDESGSQRRSARTPSTGLDRDVGRPLRLGERLDRLREPAHRLELVRLEPRAFELVPRDAELRPLAVQQLGPFAQRGVAARAHVADDLGDSGSTLVERRAPHGDQPLDG